LIFTAFLFGVNQLALLESLRGMSRGEIAWRASSSGLPLAWRASSSGLLSVVNQPISGFILVVTCKIIHKNNETSI